MKDNRRFECRQNDVKSPGCLFDANRFRLSRGGKRFEYPAATQRKIELVFLITSIEEDINILILCATLEYERLSPVIRRDNLEATGPERRELAAEPNPRIGRIATS